MTEFLIGTVGYPIAREKMHGAVDLIELTDARHIPPSVRAANHLKTGAPPEQQFAVQLSRYFVESPEKNISLKGDLEAYGQFRISTETRGLWKRQVDFANAMGAFALVMITPPSVSPSALHMDRMAAFLSQMDRGALKIVWEPHGPWDAEVATAFARDNQLVLAVDPLKDQAPDDPFAYFRFGPFSSMGSRLGVYELERIVELAAVHETVCCAFETHRALDDARNLKQLIEDGRADDDEY